MNINLDQLKSLVLVFDGTTNKSPISSNGFWMHGVPETLYGTVYDLIAANMGTASATRFAKAVTAQDDAWFMTGGTGEQVWQEILTLQSSP